MNSTLDRFTERREAQGMPDFSDPEVAAAYINERSPPDVMVFPVAEGAEAYLVDTTKKEAVPHDSPNFLREFAEETWRNQNRQV